MAYAIVTIPFDPVTKSFHPDELNRFCLKKEDTDEEGRIFSG